MSLVHILENISDLQRETLYESLKNFYLQLEHDFESIPKPCTQCGACCDFETFGHKLYISSLEFAYVSQELEKSAISDLKTCPYLMHKHCHAREKRMLGCRTFFRLHETKDQSQAQDLYEKYLQKIKFLYREHDIPWEYKDFMVFVKEAYIS